MMLMTETLTQLFTRALGNNVTVREKHEYEFEYLVRPLTALG
jgi:hypothetical protein